MSARSLPMISVCPKPSDVVMTSPAINARQANDHPCFKPEINSGKHAGKIT